VNVPQISTVMDGRRNIDNLKITTIHAAFNSKNLYYCEIILSLTFSGCFPTVLGLLCTWN
jgi:hypothetical protein